MSDPTQSRQSRSQQGSSDAGQQFLQQALEVPMEQTIQFQRNAAQILLNGLEMTSWAQSRGMDLTKDMMSTYLDTLEETSRDTERIAEEGMEAMQEIGQAQQQAASQQAENFQQSQAGHPRQTRPSQQTQPPRQTQAIPQYGTQSAQGYQEPQPQQGYQEPQPQQEYQQPQAQPGYQQQQPPAEPVQGGGGQQGFGSVQQPQGATAQQPQTMPTQQPIAEGTGAAGSIPQTEPGPQQATGTGAQSEQTQQERGTADETQMEPEQPTPQ